MKGACLRGITGACLRAYAFAALICVTAPSVHAGETASSEPSPASLYARLGGQPVVKAFVNETIDKVTADPRLKRSFKGSNLRRIKRLFAEQICQISNGGCVYSGDTMREVHANHHITEAEFYGVVEVLRSSMRDQGVALRERNELLALLAPMKRDIVEPVTPAPPTVQ
jgi:hemoglobin